MDLSGLLPFILASLLMELTPGPNMAYLAIVALGEGRAKGYAAVAGVALGLAIVGLAAALGIAAVVQASPLLYQALRWGGVAYLLWLAWIGWRGADDPPEYAARGSSRWAFFRRGLVTNLLNPKAFAFYIAVLPGFLRAGSDPARQAVMLSLLYVAIATVVHLAIVTAAAASHRLLDDPARARTIRRALSVMLAGVAVWLLIKTGR